jgi:hypothetical protein
MLGCSAVDPEPGDAEAREVEPGTVKSSLNIVNTLCQIANAVPSFDVGAFHLDDTTCTAETTDRFYYFGSDPAGDNYADTLATATYCTIATGTGSSFSGNATFSSPVGGFGAKSEVRSFARDNQNRHIESEHVGKVVVFGVEVPLQYSTTAWDFLREHQWSRGLPAQRHTANVIRNSDGSYRAGSFTFSNYTQVVPDHNGRYASWKNQNLKEWSIGGDGTVMITPALPLHIEVKLRSSEGLNNAENGRFQPNTVTDPTYSQVLMDGAVCRANCRNTSDQLCALGCPTLTPAQINGHELKCTNGCGSNFWRNIDDGILPYSGNANGASGSTMLYGDPTINYWQQGWPGTAGNDGEPQWSTLSNPPTLSTAFDLLTEARYTVGIAEMKFGVKLDYDSRAGVALRSRILPAELGQGAHAETELRADASTAINLNGFFDVRLNLFWPLGPIDLHFDYDLIDRRGSGHRSGQGASGGYSWVDNRDGLNDAGTDSCTAYQTPQTTGPNPPTRSAWDFTFDTAKASVEQFHPCNIKICVPNVPDKPAGKFTNYNWDATNLKLTEQKTNEACNVCDSTAAMCNKNGVVVSPFKTNKSATCGGSGDACGGNQVCDNDDDCDMGDSCSVGCCVTHPT